jgi:uridylate kinase
MAGAAAYRRVLLKLSGGALAGDQATGLAPEKVSYVAREIAAACETGAQAAVVIGGGNIVRGREAREMGWPQVPVDYMGMLATVINALALKEGLDGQGVSAEVLSSFGVGECCERYSRRRALELLEGGAVVIFAGGTGRPLFSTDTAAALRACEIEADAILKGTDVPGVYDSDPDDNPEARMYESLSFDEVIARDLRVMDAAAAALCRDHEIPVVVFDLRETGNVAKIIRGEKIGTYVG